MSFWKKVSAPVLVMGLASPALVNCDALGDMGVPGTSCKALETGNFADLKFKGGAKVEGQLKGFLEAVYNYDKLAVEVETDLIASCKELGSAIGMAEGELKAEPGGGEGAKQVCGAVAAKIKSILNASGEVTLSLDIKEPRCEVDVNAMMDCLEGCGAAIDPGKLEASCQGGEVSGKCTGECSGTCTIEGAAECGGTCEGTCEGECEGETTEGGKCEGTCNGKCSGTCKVEGKADCEGSCSGGCSAEIEAPKCSGEFKPPEVDAECHANCVAKTAGEAKCYPPEIDVKAEGAVEGDVEKLVAGLRTSLPKIVKIQLGMAKKLAATGEVLVKTGQQLPSIAQKAGMQAVTCIGMAGKMATEASGSVSVSVEASASVSGSAGG